MRPSIVTDLRRLGAALLLFLPLLGVAQRQHVSPSPPPPALVDLIADFAGDRDTIIVFEEDGELFRHQHGLEPVRLSVLSSTRLASSRDTMLLQSDGRFLLFHGRPYRRLAASTATFRIKLQRPVEQLRPIARRASPPQQASDLLRPELVELSSLDSTIRYDIRYASTNNFMGAAFYSQAKAFLQRPAAEALVRVHHRLREQGFGLLIHDAYRPWSVTKMFWDATPRAQRSFVANPSKGSKHNRGCAVDVSLYELGTGTVVEMPSGYDEFSHRAYADYPGGTARQRWYRQVLRDAMEQEGFTVERVEWWHFDHKDWKRYPVMNVEFERIVVSNQ